MMCTNFNLFPRPVCALSFGYSHIFIQLSCFYLRWFCLTSWLCKSKWSTVGSWLDHWWHVCNKSSSWKRIVRLVEGWRWLSHERLCVWASKCWIILSGELRPVCNLGMQNLQRVQSVVTRMINIFLSPLNVWNRELKVLEVKTVKEGFNATKNKITVTVLSSFLPWICSTRTRLSCQQYYDDGKQLISTDLWARVTLFLPAIANVLTVADSIKNKRKNHYEKKIIYKKDDNLNRTLTYGW